MARIVTRWTEEETALLNTLVAQYNNNFKLVAGAFPSRSYNQVKGHYFNELRKTQSKEQESVNSATLLGRAAGFTPSFDSEATAEKSSGELEMSFYAFQELLE
ncbi:SANT/Myb_domain [Hexamita inflata]|uniref:SANT/Myb domain n=1 Tax=Hexamita inflata TaxID=28002 RepID=A0AA86NYH8_9EUKA|nr:SANT/Myb domain [Hexamita inflata]CAI9928944.1 SANT/Myb domain [Hexamita inflata]CAI9928946.1 SANT/Myb domain [Hexamita inflata]